MRVPLALAKPLGRAMWRTPVLGVAVFAAAPSVYAAARGHHDLSFPVTLATITGAASVSFALDDPAETSLTSCPTARSARRWMRAGLISLAVAGAWLLVVASAHYAHYPLAPWRVRLVQAAAAAAISLAFAARASRDGSNTPGLAPVAGTLLTLVVSSGLALRVAWLPQVGHPGHTQRWWTVAATATALAYWWSRDPASRGPHRSRAYIRVETGRIEPRQPGRKTRP